MLPNPSDYDLYRRKWNYVKHEYNSGYLRCEDAEEKNIIPVCTDPLGTWFTLREEFLDSSICDPNLTPNAAYWLDYNRFQREFYEHLFEWTEYAHNRGINAVIFERWLQWKFEIGSSTNLYGNLSQHTRNDHIGHCWMLCPYDSNNNIERTRALLGLGDSEFPIEGRNDHGKYYMKTASRGSVWGFECSSPTCPYLTTYSGTYFYS